MPACILPGFSRAQHSVGTLTGNATLTQADTTVNVCGDVALSLPLVAANGQVVTVTNVCGGTVTVGNMYSPPEPVVVGSVTDGVTARGFVWSASAGAQFITSGATAAAVSESGVVVGYYSGGLVISSAFKWTAGGGIVDLGDLGGGQQAVAAAVSPDGSVVVGYSTNGSAVTEAFVWTQAGGMQGLGFPLGYTASSRATGVSNSGTIVGNASSGITQTGFIFPPGGSMTVIAGSVSVFAVSDADAVVGVDTLGRGFVWSSGGGFVYLTGLTDMVPQSISRDGTIVGGYWNNNGDDAPFVWTQAGGAVDLSAVAPTGAGGVSGVVNDGFACGTTSVAYLWSAAGGVTDVFTQLGWGTSAVANGLAVQRTLTSLPIGDSLTFEASYYPTTAAPAFLSYDDTAYLIAEGQASNVVSYGYIRINAAGELVVSDRGNISANEFAGVARTITKRVVERRTGATQVTFTLDAPAGVAPIYFRYIADGRITNYAISDVNNVALLPATITAYVR